MSQIENPSPCAPGHPQDYYREPAEFYREMHRLEDDVKKNGTITAGIQGIVVVIVVGLMGWVATEVQGLGKTMTTVQGSILSLEAKLSSSNQIQRLELTQLETTLRAKQELIERRMQDHQKWLDQIWPRLRALQQNQGTLKDKITLLHKDKEIEIILQTPEKF